MPARPVTYTFHDMLLSDSATHSICLRSRSCTYVCTDVSSRTRWGRTSCCTSTLLSTFRRSPNTSRSAAPRHPDGVKEMFGLDRRSNLNVSITPFAHWSIGRPLLAASQGLYPESPVGDDRAKLDRLSQVACALLVKHASARIGREGAVTDGDSSRH